MSDLNILRGKRILLGITGGIGAYKSAELARSFIRHGAQVSVVMTQSATRFISPLTMEALTHNPVGVDLFSLSEERAISHIERARWADIMVIAPATANYLAKSALGIADDLVTTITLAADCPQVVVPAMNSVMWAHSAVQENLEKIQARGIISVPPGFGELACGEEGPGRMADIEQIVSAVTGCLQSGDLSGIRILVTAGPTRETIDPVRFLSNRSSGKMGYSLVQAAADRGADVVLVTGPTGLERPDRATVLEVITAEEMLTVTKA
jgi:phosphopantothenoylcysteine decarboxylase/phosphopantothenate--cysteine ligase